MQPKISIIIINWNGYEDTYECLISLRKVKYPNFSIIVVDNNSAGDDVRKLEENFSSFIEIIELKDNLGFSGGNNKGIRTAIDKGTDYVLLLNNDTVVEPDFLTKLVSAGLDDSEIGIRTPKINFYKKKEKIWSAGGYISYFRGSGFSIGENSDDNKYDKSKYVSFASGCCLLIKKEVIEKVGYWDEKYFLYLEDADYCKRSTNLGYKILFVADSKIYHKVNSSTSKTISSLPIYYTTRNRLYFSKKLLGVSFYIVIFFLLITFSLKFIIWWLKNERSNITMVFLAIRDFFNKKMGKLNPKIEDNVENRY